MNKFTTAIRVLTLVLALPGTLLLVPFTLLGAWAAIALGINCLRDANECAKIADTVILHSVIGLLAFVALWRVIAAGARLAAIGLLTRMLMVAALAGGVAIALWIIITKLPLPLWDPGALIYVSAILAGMIALVTLSLTLLRRAET